MRFKIGICLWDDGEGTYTQTEGQTDIARYRLNWSIGQLSENQILERTRQDRESLVMRTPVHQVFFYSPLQKKIFKKKKFNPLH